MGMATSGPTYHTADVVRALIDEKRAWPRYETIRGELHVTPAPRPWHQLVLERLRHALSSDLATAPIGIPFASPADISRGRDDVLVQSDLFVLPIEQAGAATTGDSWARVHHLQLAVEILSPGSVRADRFTTRTLSQQMGVPLYWIVDTEAHSVKVWTPEAHLPAVERETLRWRPAPGVPLFEHTLAERFRPL